MTRRRHGNRAVRGLVPRPARCRGHHLCHRRRLSLETLESRRLLATFVVTTQLDVVDSNDSVTSLREAISDANNASGSDSILFDAAVFAAPREIQLQLGQLDITDPLTISGPGEHLVRINAQQNSRVLNFSSVAGDLTLTGLTLTGGSTSSDDLDSSASGGAIRFSSAGTLTLTGVSVVDNETRGNAARGGGIFASTGDLVLERSTVSGNRTLGVDAAGGGIFAASGNVAVFDSTISGNSTSQSGAQGGGIHAAGGSLSVARSRLTFNSTSGRRADGGGALAAAGITVDSSVVTGNTTSGQDADGGAIFANGLVAVLRSDLSNNTVGGRYSAGGALTAEAAELVIQDSSITGNQTEGQRGYGAGVLAVRSDVTITGSTISSNRASGSDTDGGGLSAFFSSVTVNSSTITLNSTTGEGGGIAFTDNENRSLVIRNTILAGNSDLGVAPDFLAPQSPLSLTVQSSLIGNNRGTTLSEALSPDASGNLIGDPSGGGVIDPMLDPLLRIGITRVHPLQAGSLAVGAGNNAFVAAIPNDQRGQPFARIANPIVDMGAYELQTLSPSLFVVTTANDEFDFSNPEVSLREAIAAANGIAGSDTITFDPFVFAQPQRIDLTLGELTIIDSVTLEGPGSEILTIDAGGDGRVMFVPDGSADVTLSGLTVTGGMTTAPNSSGGGIRFDSSGTLTIRSSVVRGNHTGGDHAPGGGVFSGQGVIVLDRSVIADNSTLGRGARGGGVYGGGGLFSSESTITNNRTDGDDASGGGVYVSAAAEDATAIQLTQSTVSGNLARGGQSRGGGVALARGAAQIVNSTLSGNSAADDGGGLFSETSPGADHQIAWSTIAQNAAGGTGGGLSFGVDISGSLTITSSIVASNDALTSAPDLDLARGVGDVIVQSTLVGDNAGSALSESQTPDASGNLIGAAGGAGVIDPLLGPLMNRGGPTQTHSLRVGSPAINAADPALLAQLTTDQRGAPFVRSSGRAPDMGSYETQTIAPSFLLVNTATDELDFSNTDVSLREALIYAAGSEGIDTIRFDPTVFSQPTSIHLALGQLDITDSVQIEGPGADWLTIDAGGLSRVIEIATAQVDVVLAGMTITGGRTTADQQQGAGIRFAAAGSLTLKGVTVRNNHTTGQGASGGGIHAETGSLTFSGVLVTENTTQGLAAFGGGVSASESAVTIVDSVLSNNSTSGELADGGGLSASGALNHSVLIMNSRVTGNVTASANADGGGISRRNGDLTLVGVTVDQNTTSGEDSSGGGLFFRAGEVSIRDSTFQSNTTSGLNSDGGGLAIHESTSASVTESAVAGNATSGSQSSGGGIYLFDTQLSMVNSTVSGNATTGTGSSGGGVYSDLSNSISAVNTTITGNAAANMGGGISLSGGASESVTIHNSIIAGNSDAGGAPDLAHRSSPVNLDLASSLIGDNAGNDLAEAQVADAMGNLIGSDDGDGVIDPLLGPLANNGGTTPTHALNSGSPAINAGDNSLAIDGQSNPFLSDQRGDPFLRFFGTVDIGAVEVQPPREPIVLWPTPANIFAGTPLGDLQLNASTDTAGTFVYTPAAGTVLDLGDAQTLMVEFTPDDTVNYTSATASVLINVVDQSDLGDAPDSYATRRLNGGPRHLVGSLFLGVAVDSEVDGQPSSDAGADAGDDGVTLVSSLVSDPFDITTSTFMVTASGRGKLDAWIDFDRDGVFDHPAEHIGGGTSVDVFTGLNLVEVTVPDTAIPGPTFARFRISSDGDLNPTGPAPDGEVEDYAVTLLDGATAPTVDLTLPFGPISLSVQQGDFVLKRLARELFRAAASNVGRFEIIGDEFSNVLTIDSNGGRAIPDGGLFYDGTDRVNTVRLLGPDSSIDVSRNGDVSLRNIDVIDITDPAESTVTIDSRAARAMDPTGGGIIVVGSPGDTITFADASAWRMREPTVVAGFHFSNVSIGDTFVAVDFASPWQNLAQPNDISNDGNVTAGDALRIINELSRRAFSDPDTAVLDNPSDVPIWPGVYFDQNGDELATALDALRVINQLSRQSNGAGVGQGEMTALGAEAEQVIPAVHPPPSSRSSTEQQLRDLSGEIPVSDPIGRREPTLLRATAPGPLADNLSARRWQVKQTKQLRSETLDQLLADPDFVSNLDVEISAQPDADDGSPLPS